MEVNLVDLIDQYGSEEKCRAYLEELRWPHGVECPRCGGTTISRIAKRNQFDCDSCRYQFSVTAGTLFHDSHLPLWKWFLAVYLMAESKKGISAKQMQRMLKVSYKTAWYLAHRIRDAMGDDEQPLLRGIVEVDETWLGGKGRGQGKTTGKANIVGAVQRNGEIRLKLIPDRHKDTLHAFIAEHTERGTMIFTDEHPSYKSLPPELHRAVKHQAEQYVDGEVHTQGVENVWSLFKRSVVGSYHKVSLKHLPAYLDEMEFRFNGRENPYLFRDTLLVLLHGDALPYRRLVDSHS
jgi:transposase-like protein